MELLERGIASTFRRNWWVLLLRGLAAIAFGILTWVQPGISLATLVLFFGAFALVDGVLAVCAAIVGRETDESWWVLLLGGLIGIGVGTVTFIAPGITTFGLLFYIAIWAIAIGVTHALSAIRLRKEIEGEWLYIIGGIASVVFGFILMTKPGAGALALLWLIAAYAVGFGILLVILAFRVRNIGNRIAHT